MASEGNGVSATRFIYRIEQITVAIDRCPSQGLSRKYDTHMEFFDNSCEIGEDGGEYQEEHNGTWWWRWWSR